jgi:hypothetical protein
MQESELMGTAEVADEAEVSQQEARDWAADNDVQRVGNVFVWTPEDVDDFIADLDEDADEDDDEDGDEDDGDADEDDEG